MIGEARGGRCTVRLWAPLSAEGQAELVLGRNFRIDEELLARVAGLPGVRSAEFASTAAMLAVAA
jgi:DNA polymerase-3 subunit alpha